MAGVRRRQPRRDGLRRHTEDRPRSERELAAVAGWLLRLATQPGRIRGVHGTGGARGYGPAAMAAFGGPPAHRGSVRSPVISNAPVTSGAPRVRLPPPTLIAYFPARTRCTPSRLTWLSSRSWSVKRTVWRSPAFRWTRPRSRAAHAAGRPAVSGTSGRPAPLRRRRGRRCSPPAPRPAAADRPRCSPSASAQDCAKVE